MGRFFRHAFLLLLLAATASLLPATASAMTADEYFADGNRLFRDDLYWAALLRYRQASEAGLDSAVLDYNTGVAHYRARQHIRARAALLTAAENPALRAIAHYNLGLNADALGDTGQALRWFQLAREQAVDGPLRSYAEEAIARLQRDSSVVTVAAVDPVAEQRAFANLELRARISYGTDDNVFRSPDTPYIDFADPARPRISPAETSGAFVPVSLSARYTVNSLPFEGFFGAYRVAGRYYEDSLLENANEYFHEASFGNLYQRKEGSRLREVHGAFTVAQHDEIYYDRDDGSARSVDGVNIDSRMNYLRYGPELSLRQSGERVAFGAKLKGQLWNYKNTEAVPEYDHEYLFLQLFGQYRFSEGALLRITASGYSRRYSDRPSYDLDGQQRRGNPGVRYDYVSLGLRARQRILGSFWIGVDLARTERIDQYRGYNDFTRDSYAFEASWTPGQRFGVKLKGSYHLYDYPSAFAFHDPAVARKTQESADFFIGANYRISDHFDIVAEARYFETVSNDIRIQFERNQYLLGLRWQH